MTSSALHRHAAALALAGLLPTAAQAASFLIAQDYLGALVGGPTGGYNQQLNPAYSPTTLVASDAVQFTAGNPVDPALGPVTASVSGSSSVGFGLMSASSMTSASGYAAYAAAAEGEKAGYAFDVVTVHGSGPITVTLHTALSGLSVLDDPASGSVAVRANTYFGPAGFVDDSKIAYLSDEQLGASRFNTVQTASVTVADGESFYVIATMTRNNTEQLLTGADLHQGRTVNATTQATYGDWITLSAGASLTSDSGWTYTAPTAVPEPATAPLLLLGGALLAARLRRRQPS